ncbi:ubiquitin and wlm domain-containing metalloprotease spcc1442.07c [Phtheirospermum japonicum]|uniref:Ubiquitin and wlm domain-containing metalloprotease spcc1442.07c n=1 Tax=Phtheirospermum japonicum TaxID=374723 RepID=A0A830CCT7_9LAMI|nr:ubiquitin and wlm domain-containing metalloprotease spcc1442.07c [Phtheirospermum japonicum]
MAQQQEIICLVVWTGQKIIVEMSQNATFKELGEKLQEFTNVKADTLRLLVPIENSSKMLYPFSNEHSSLRLDSTLILKGKSVRMMGVPNDEVDELLQNVKADLRIAGFDDEEKRTLSLPGIELNPPASRALELLHKLASDPGIVAIMNKNCGEEISLRLRTDDLKGFRKYESIKKTLLHELAHMVFSEHDSNFYALDSQLNKEAATLDWTKSRGHTLIGGTHSRHYEEEFDISSSNNVTSSQKLGGQAPVLHNARAASKNTATPDPDDCEGEKPMVLEPYVESGDSLIEPDFNGEIQESGDEPHPDDSHAEDMQTEIVSGESFPRSQIVEPDPDDSELRIIQDPVTIFCGRLQSAVHNVIEHPDDMKFKKLRKANPMIQRNIITYKAATDILTLIGFCEDVITDEWGKAEAYLMLKRNDPGLLWLAKSSLETHIS